MLYQLSYRGSVEGVPITSRVIDCKAGNRLTKSRVWARSGKHLSFTVSCYSSTSARQWGLVAEWLRRGLQILVRGFDSLRGLQLSSALRVQAYSSKPRQLQGRAAQIDPNDSAEQVDLNAL